MKFILKKQRFLLHISMALYILCMPFTGITVYYESSFGSDNIPSILIIIFGIFGFGASYANIMWILNPWLFLIWLTIFKKMKIIAVLSSIIVLSSAIGICFVETVSVSSDPNPAKITGLGVGYWLWVASMGMALLASLLMPNASDNPDRYADY